MGITSDFPVTRSLALGVAEVSVIDMTSAYSVFASGGYKTPAYGILKINTTRGDLIYQKEVDAPRERVLSEQTVGYMDTLMRAVVTGGHLGAGLGVVELTVALHYVFDTPRDRLIWDVGHQAYPHKILTGRRDRIRTLRQGGGLSGRHPRLRAPG